MLVRVVSAYFVAGLVFEDGFCVYAAPILGWCVGKERDALRAQFVRRGWAAHVLRDWG